METHVQPDNFATLIPAFTARVVIDAPIVITSNLVQFPLVPDRGSLTSEPEYPLQLRATFINGSDYVRPDPSGSHLSLDVSGTARDELSGELLRMVYNGVVTLGPGEKKILGAEAGAQTTRFGNVFTQVRFEADGPCFGPLRGKLFVGSGRFVLEKDMPAVVEYKISEVAAGPIVD